MIIAAQQGRNDGSVFVDWVTLSQWRPTGSFPFFARGVTSFVDAGGVCRFERVSPVQLRGSHGTSVQVGCDGGSVYLSGNVGRLGREDNLFNHGWVRTLALANRVVLGEGLPVFGSAESDGQGDGARLHRIDLTSNFATGNDGQARALIRWLAGRAVHRVKRGLNSDESVWWANTRYMFKAYRKGVELEAHGLARSHPSVQWCHDNGVVRVEVELKRRYLGELGLSEVGLVTQEKLEQVYHDETAVLRTVDRSDEPDLIDSLPKRCRLVVDAWLKGVDLASTMSRATLFRHARVCREYGINILEPRNVVSFPTRVRVIELRPCEVPDWYELDSPLDRVA